MERSGRILDTTQALQRFPWVQELVATNPIVLYQNIKSVTIIEVAVNIFMFEELMELIPAVTYKIPQMGNPHKQRVEQTRCLMAFRVSAAGKPALMNYAVASQTRHFRVAKPIGSQITGMKPQYVVLHELIQQPFWRNALYIYKVPKRRLF